MASLTSTSPLGRGCAPVCVGIGVEISVWFRRLGSWIWVWWVLAFGLLDFQGSWWRWWWWWVVLLVVRFVICSCGFVLWCVVDDGCAVFCGAVGFFFFFAVDGWWL